jgi:chorismate mutase
MDNYALILTSHFLYAGRIKMPAGDGELAEIRKRIDELDDRIADLLAQRMYYASEARAEKVRMNRPIVDEQRQNEVIAKWCERARKPLGSKASPLSEELLSKLAALIIEYTVKEELEDR